MQPITDAFSRHYAKGTLNQSISGLFVSGYVAASTLRLLSCSGSADVRCHYQKNLVLTTGQKRNEVEVTAATSKCSL